MSFPFNEAAVSDDTYMAHGKLQLGQGKKERSLKSL
jgi:hypothetical protein